MNIKLAEKVFPECHYNAELGELLLTPAFPRSMRKVLRPNYASNPAHKLKLIEFIAKQLQPKNNLLMKANVRRAKKEAALEAIATGDTEKLVEIAESMIDE